jgi:uncharacterized membrane protein
MGAGHSHERVPVRVSERTTTILSIAVVGVIFLTAFGAAFVWPTDSSFRGSLPTIAEGARWVSATVTEVTEDGTAFVVINGEEDSGPLELLSYGDRSLVLTPGDRIRAMQFEDGQLGFSDFERGPPMILLAVLYGLLVIVIAWWRGIGALLGLAAAFGMVLFFTVPALFGGGSPLVIALVTGSGALFVLLYLAHGPNARTTTAYLGTLVGLVITALLAWWAVDASKLTGLWSEDGIQLEFFNRGVSLQGLVLCGIILAGLGVLNDVTVTQASAVWELKAARPDMGWRQLYTSGMRIGRDHIASTVYTIAFAYVGAALPTIMIVSMYNASIGQTLTAGDIAEEVVRTLVGSIGLVLAVPITTLIGALVASQDTGAPEPAVAQATIEE